MKFQERFLNKNETGGQEAADELHGRVESYLQSRKIDVTGTDVVVRAYANMNRLQLACVRNGNMKPGVNLHLFAQGFNQRRALFDFVDVGAGKERADNKIKGPLVPALPVYRTRLADGPSRMPAFLYEQPPVQACCPWRLSRFRLCSFLE